MRAVLSRIARSTAVRLAVVAFVVYNANLRPISSADTFPARYIPISLLTQGNLDLDEFAFLRDSRYPLPGDEASGMPYYLQLRRGHYMSTYPVMPALLATPVYVLPVVLGLTDRPAAPDTDGFTWTEIIGTLLSKIAASAAIAASVALVYLTLLRYTTGRGALWIALIYAFATSTWAVSSQGLWQTTMSQMLLAGALYALVRARESAAPRGWLAGAGTGLALAVACRPPAVIFALLLTLYVWRAHRRQLPAFLVVPVLVAGLLLAYNLYYFGTLNGGYEGYSGNHLLTPSQIWQGFTGLLVSPNRGMLVFSPVLVFAFGGLALALRRRQDPLLEYVAVATLLTIAFYTTFTVWYGAFSYSYRYLVDLLPGLALFLALAWDWIAARRWRRVALVTLTAYSVAIQVVGVVYYPCDWYESPIRNPAAIERMFDWGNLEVVQCLRAGPVEPDGVRFLRGLRAGR